jgi:hypothetical protein
MRDGTREGQPQHLAAQPMSTVSRIRPTAFQGRGKHLPARRRRHQDSQLTRRAFPLSSRARGTPIASRRPSFKLNFMSVPPFSLRALIRCEHRQPMAAGMIWVPDGGAITAAPSLRDAFAAAIETGLPVLTSVSPVFDTAWREFASLLYSVLTADADAMDTWWRSIRSFDRSPAA